MLAAPAESAEPSPWGEACAAASPPPPPAAPEVEGSAPDFSASSSWETADADSALAAAAAAAAAALLTDLGVRGVLALAGFSLAAAAPAPPWVLPDALSDALSEAAGLAGLVFLLGCLRLRVGSSDCSDSPPLPPSDDSA
jgi:hypothetical protein